MKNIFLIGLIFSILGCETIHTSYKSAYKSLYEAVHESVTEIEYPFEFKEAHLFLKEGNFDRAAEEVNLYLQRRKDIYWYGHAYLLLGEAVEGQGNENEAVAAYKEAIKYGAGYNSPIMATAIYRLSWVYERQKKYKDLLVLLLDLVKNLPEGDVFVKNIETPARIANVYYVLDKWKLALSYRERANKNFDKLSGRQEKALGKTKVYRFKRYISFQSLKGVKTFTQHNLEKLRLTQEDLLDIGEMADAQMSKFSYESLIKEYEFLWADISRKIVFKTPVKKVRHNKEQLAKAVDVMDMLALLKSYRRPPELVLNVNLTLDFFKALERYESRLKSFVRNLEVGLGESNRGINPKEEAATPSVLKKKPRKQIPRSKPVLNKELANPKDVNL